MLEVGNKGLTIAEQRTHFALWAIMASPLLIGSDVSKLTPTSLSILGNVDITAVNQDSLGVQGLPVGGSTADVRTASCWYKPLAGGSIAAMVINTGGNTTELACKLSDLGVTKTPKAITDLWAKKPVVATGGVIRASLESHDHMFVKITF